MPTTISNYKYKTFDAVMASVESDLGKWADEGYIDRGQYIKVIRECNSFLGLKINGEREMLLTVKDHTALLPEDFQFLQLALAIKTHSVSGPILMGAQTESHTGEIPVPIHCQMHTCGDTMDGPCDNPIWITQKIGIKTHTYTDIETLELTQSSHSRCTDTCLNFHFRSSNQIRIQDDHATFSFKHGAVYINYISDMLDENNNVLILDHPYVNDYYEYAVKKRFFENMFLNKEGDFLQAYQVTKAELREAKIKAMGFVNTPEFGELQRIFIDNRSRFYNRYVRYFDNSKVGYFEGHANFKHLWRKDLR